MTSTEIRQSFLDFFASKNHRIVPSSPVVPLDDPTLLFTNAGMNQFKDVFLGAGKRDYVRAADTQKCIRVSGKHNDLEEVGVDTYHHTFFEMLGNWSFGDYYKKEAIEWAWELLTEVWKLPKDRLYATVYKNDDEAHDLWYTITDITPGHVLRFGEKDNFWEMGDTGPCGPCSEIHIDLTEDKSGGPLVNQGSPLVMEIWNLVFIQYNRDETGALTELPAKHVDTGMGFERVCAVMQGKKSNYDSDVFTPVLKRIEQVSGQAYEGDTNTVAMRVIADHVRMLTFAVADGALPGPEGRGYVLRRILRRASRFGRNLGMKEPFLWRVVETLTDTMGPVFPEIVQNRAVIEKVIKAEEESFNATLDRGLEVFEDVVERLKKANAKTIPGEDVFKLYDTFGFPADLTALLARERGYEVDEARFDALLEEQKTRSRAVTKQNLAIVTGSEEGLPQAVVSLFDTPSTFAGYDTLETETEVADIARTDQASFIVLAETPFYVESGGQVSDTGLLKGGEEEGRVSGLLKNAGSILHIVPNGMLEGLSKGDAVRAVVDARRRRDIMRNHTATHLVHAALRKVLGTHVQQAGSLVDPEHLRFDFSHYAKVSEEELRAIEEMVNDVILDMLPVTQHRNIPFDEARKMGALMFFGDKYGDKVNVVQVADYSMEFCGGTHVKNTSEIGLLKIVSEGSIASGTRRLEAVTGRGVERRIDELQISIEDERLKGDELLEKIRQLEKELAKARLAQAAGALDDLVAKAEQWNGSLIAVASVAAMDMEQLKSMGDLLRERLKSGVGVLGAVIDGKVALVCVVTDDLISGKGLKAGALVGTLAKQLGGGGGGKPHLATAGAKDVDKLDEALRSVSSLIRETARS